MDARQVIFTHTSSSAALHCAIYSKCLDLPNIDFVVISHRHADHTSGITYLCAVAVEAAKTHATVQSRRMNFFQLIGLFPSKN
jgi:metal-dependent hydrolase (beta-lactamase superfamily II)